MSEWSDGAASPFTLVPTDITSVPSSRRRRAIRNHQYGRRGRRRGTTPLLRAPYIRRDVFRSAQ